MRLCAPPVHGPAPHHESMAPLRYIQASCEVEVAVDEQRAGVSDQTAATPLLFAGKAHGAIFRLALIGLLAHACSSRNAKRLNRLLPLSANSSRAVSPGGASSMNRSLLRCFCRQLPTLNGRPCTHKQPRSAIHSRKSRVASHPYYVGDASEFLTTMAEFGAYRTTLSRSRDAQTVGPRDQGVG